MIAHPIAHLIGYPIGFRRVNPNRPRIAPIGSVRIGPIEPCGSHSFFSSAPPHATTATTSPMPTAATGDGR